MTKSASPLGPELLLWPLRASLNRTDLVKSPIIGLRGGPILGKLGEEWIRAQLKFSIFGLDEVGKASYAFRADCS